MMDYSTLLAKRVTDMKPSGIRKFFDLLDQQKDVIGLTVGQPDFITPWHIRSAAIESLEQGKTYYTSNAGLLSLRRVISDYLSRRFDLSYQAESEIIVTVGGSEAIDLAIRTLVNPGDEVIVPVPSFVCYGPITDLACGVPIFLETTAETEFKLTPEALKKTITPRTKVLVLPYPSNPTGAIMTKEELAAIAEVLRGTNIFILADEIYAELTYGKRHTSIATLPDMRERTIIASGCSKAYAMTGWRIGYLAAPAAITKQMLKIHQYGIMSAPTTSQYAALEAIANGDEDIAYMVGEYEKRRNYIVEGLRSIGIPCFTPEGAFYVFADLRKFGMSVDAFCERLLYEGRVAIVPGTAFGACGEGFARLSYAYSVEHITEALARIRAFTEQLKQEKAKA